MDSEDFKYFTIARMFRGRPGSGSGPDRYPAHKGKIVAFLSDSDAEVARRRLDDADINCKYFYRVVGVGALDGKKFFAYAPTKNMLGDVRKTEVYVPAPPGL